MTLDDLIKAWRAQAGIMDALAEECADLGEEDEVLELCERSRTFRQCADELAANLPAAVPMEETNL